MALDKPYKDIPGTTVFDSAQCRKGYHLNQFCMSLMKEENRKRFLADERAYLDEWPLTEDMKQAVIDRDLTRLIELGGNVYFLVKITATDGVSVRTAVASMTDMTEDEYAEMLAKGGRPAEGNRSLKDWQ
ncbi:protocatechuate 4,5-dioxygenase subunit alpha [Emcibacter sp.]|uniref:protocatechuate 4,5-dioxygenase subunit alpha n=1 Tax=Emcibacter sp. TaxID=1979954 RepID=UPI003A8EF00E